MTDPLDPTAAASLDGQQTALKATRSDALPPRYTADGWFGRGGMGEVRRVLDGLLGRVVAMKVIRPALATNDAAVERFLREARITAGLGHPSVVAVYDQGTLPDGRVWYTMPAIEGQTLAEALPGLPLRRKVESLVRVAQAMGFAHLAGIVHRDLKPSNVMVGAFGEVLVLDWGLARRFTDAPDGVLGTPDVADPNITRSGQVLGTPAYMSPEQARGLPVTAATDVFALGAMLHTVLYGQPPGFATDDVVVPDPLRAACRHALAPQPEDRPRALALSERLQAWLDDAQRRSEAQELLDEAHAVRAVTSDARARARRAAAQAATILRPLPPHASVDFKRPGWAFEEAAQAALREVALLEVQMLHKARAALERDPQFDAAHATLADFYRTRAERAEMAHDGPRAAEALALLRIHDRGAHAAWLAGHAPLTLHVAAADAQLTLRSVQLIDRRIVPAEVIAQGPAPWVEMSVAKGSYTLQIDAPGHATVHMPVQIERAIPWHAGPPDDPDRPVRLPKTLGVHEAFVPAGWCVVGDPEALDGHPPRRLWIDAFIMLRHPITNAEYITFLDALVAANRMAEAEQCMPLEEGGVSHEPRSIYRRDAEGRHHLATDGFGQVWHAEQPAVSISWDCAAVYRAWRSAQDGVGWRLPHALEWEKAARGADGRIYPWGDHFEATWTCALHTRDGPPRRVGVTQTPMDISPYGIFGFAGNAREWCASGFLRAPPADQSVLDPSIDRDDAYREVRGGAMLSMPAFCRAGARFGMAPDQRRATVTFRLVRDLGSDCSAISGQTILARETT